MMGISLKGIMSGISLLGLKLKGAKRMWISPTNIVEDAFKSMFGELLGGILWLLIVGIVVGMIIATAIAYYNSCFLVRFLPIYCTCY